MTLHPLAEGYLSDLEQAAARLPRHRRAELIDDIESHLDEALGPDATDAQARDAIDRLGDPEEIVQAADPAQRPPVAERGVLLEIFTVLLLLFGGFVLFVGWLVGVAMLWTSRAWSTRDKLIGTLVPPGGLLVSAYIGLAVGSVCTSTGTGPDRCTGGSGPAASIALLALAIAPLFTAAYLLWRMRRARAAI